MLLSLQFRPLSRLFFYWVRCTPLALCAVATLLSVPFVRPAQAQTTGKREWLETEATASAAGKRVALVVGNTHYSGKNGLTNPENDARAMAHTLQALGFEVLMCLDQTNRQMADDVSEFGTRINGASVALFYFSGHGSQVEGINYLIPVGFEGHSANDIKYDALNVGRVLDTLAEAKSHVNIIILDACRDNPFTHGAKSTLMSRGLAPVDAPGGTLIAYATAPGKTAEDNPNGANGLFTQELLRQIKIPDQRIEDVFINTRRSVREASAGKQVPWEESSLENQFYFAFGKTPFPPPVHHDGPVAGGVKINPKDGAEMVWIPAGSFLMGDDDDDILNYTTKQRNNPRHEVTLSGYWMYKNLVTTAMYRAFCQATGRQMLLAPSWGFKDSFPIVGVTWEEAKAYCDWAEVQLPTEAQWEKAARGTDGRKYPWGNVFDESRLCCSTKKARLSPTPVGSFLLGASPYGILDMAGNVWQWCSDWYDDGFWKGYHSNNPDPINNKAANVPGLNGPRRVLRGGSWGDFNMVLFRSALRGVLIPATRNDSYGFRGANSN